MKETKPLSIVLFTWRRFLIRSTVLAAIVAVGVSLALPRWYTASATIMPPREGSGGGLLQLMSQLGGGSGGGSGKAARRLFSRNLATELMLGVLKSRRVRGEIVDRFGLVEVYDAPGPERAIKILATHLKVDTTPDGLIRVQVEDRDPERAAEMANAFLERLDLFNRQTSVENAQRTVEFIEGCLAENRARREAASDKLRRYQEEKGAVEISEQTRATVEAIAELQAEKMRLEIRRGVLENYTGPDQLEVRRIDDEIREIESSIAALRGTASGEVDADPGTTGTAANGVFLPFAVIPKLALEFSDLKREVIVHEKVYEFLAAQYEDARIQETRDQQTIQFVDEAVPPVRKSRPRRSLIVVLTTLLALVTAVGTALAGETLLDRFAEDDPESSALREGLGPLLRILAGLRAWGVRPVEPGPESSSGP